MGISTNCFNTVVGGGIVPATTGIIDFYSIATGSSKKVGHIEIVEKVGRMSHYGEASLGMAVGSGVGDVGKSGVVRNG